jgi:hypothetical protein
MTMFANLAGQTAKSFENHPGKWPFGDKPESGRWAGVGPEISK